VRGLDLRTPQVSIQAKIIFVDRLDEAETRRVGPMLERHPAFPQRTNVQFARPAGPDTLDILIWERGAGETLSCGTGACAAAVAGISSGLLDSPVRVETRGGTLTIAWAGGDNPVWMKGPAETVYEGTLEL